jgi:glycosyltransferase involved in cell wall biosynthesis
MKNNLRILLVVTHVRHYFWQNQLFAYGPYTLEIDMWADLFSEIVVAAPCRDEPPSGDAIPYSRQNIRIAPQAETGGSNFWLKAQQILMLPILTGSLIKAMRQVDAIHVRCPGNLGLLGTILAPLFSRYRVAKYAGQWNGYPNEPWTVRLQRTILSSSWWKAPVTVYGDWPNQPDHVISFITSMMSKKQMENAKHIAASKNISANPLNVLYSGRLVKGKRIDVIIRAIHLFENPTDNLKLVIVGDGSERDNLEKFVKELGIESSVQFTGALPYDEALKWYQWAHCLVLPSKHSEGWPKVVAEAMAHGLVTIAVAHGQIPRMLADRGVLLQNGSDREIADALQKLISQPDLYEKQRQAAMIWAQQFTLEGLRDALRNLLAKEWGVEFPSPYQTAALENQESHS